MIRGIVYILIAVVALVVMKSEYKRVIARTRYGRKLSRSKQPLQFDVSIFTGAVLALVFGVVGILSVIRAIWPNLGDTQ